MGRVNNPDQNGLLPTGRLAQIRRFEPVTWVPRLQAADVDQTLELVCFCHGDVDLLAAAINRR